MQSPYGPQASRVSTYRPNAAAPRMQNAGPGLRQLPYRKPIRAPRNNYVPPRAAAPGQQPGPQGAGPMVPPKVDYSGDPILQQIIAGQDQSLARGRAGLLDTQKQLLLRLGSRSLASKVLGNDPFVNTISDDPNTSFSLLGQIGRQYDQQQYGFNEDMNQSNLFYSGARVKGLQDLAYNRLSSENEAITGTQDALTDAMGQFQALQEQMYAQRQQAEREAYDRALQLALAYGYTGEQPGGQTAATPQTASQQSVMTAAKQKQLEKLLG